MGGVNGACALDGFRLNLTFKSSRIRVATTPGAGPRTIPESSHPKSAVTCRPGAGKVHTGLLTGSVNASGVRAIRSVEPATVCESGGRTPGNSCRSRASHGSEQDRHAQAEAAAEIFIAGQVHWESSGREGTTAAWRDQVRVDEWQVCRRGCSRGCPPAPEEECKIAHQGKGHQGSDSQVSLAREMSGLCSS